MNKNIFFALILFTTTFQILPTPEGSGSAYIRHYCKVFVTFIFGDSQQPQENPDQAPAGVNIDNYITQLRSDLNGQNNQYKPVIPAHEMSEIEAAVKINLRNIDLRDKDITNQVIRSILIEQVKIGTIRDLDALAYEGFYISKEEYKSIPTSYEGNIRVRLESIPHNLNGEAIAQYFGEARKNELRDSLKNRSTYR